MDSRSPLSLRSSEEASVLEAAPEIHVTSQVSTTDRRKRLKDREKTYNVLQSCRESVDSTNQGVFTLFRLWLTPSTEPKVAGSSSAGCIRYNSAESRLAATCGSGKWSEAASSTTVSTASATAGRQGHAGLPMDGPEQAITRSELAADDSNQGPIAMINHTGQAAVRDGL